MNGPPNWALVDGVADRYGVTTRTVKNWERAGWIRGYRMGRVVRYDLDEVEAAFRSGRFAGRSSVRDGQAGGAA